jgi:hypothetical protein
MRKSKSRTKPVAKKEGSLTIFNYGLSAEEKEEEAKKFLCLVVSKNKVEERKASTGDSYMLMARQLVFLLLKKENFNPDPYGDFGFDCRSGDFYYNDVWGRIIKNKETKK